MRARSIAVGISALALALAGCNPSGSATDAPGTPAPGTPAPTAAAAACATTTEPAGVAVTIKDFAFGPASITASVGQPIGWTNEDGAGHTATLDDGACATGTISPGGGTAALVFTQPGTYPYHCAIHPQMKGTIVIN